jgi:hypothetical protein
METGVRYFVKHSGNFLYKLSNESDRLTFKLYKIQLPATIASHQIAESSSLEQPNNKDVVKSELLPVNKNLNSRNAPLIV